AAREARRADRLHAMRERSRPAPGDRSAHGDRVHGRVGATVVTAHELDTGTGRHRADRAAAAPTVATATAVRARAAVTAAPCQRREHEHPDHYSAYTHAILLSSPACGSSIFPS